MLKAPLIEQTNTDPSLPVNMYYSLNAHSGQPGLLSCPGYDSSYQLLSGSVDYVSGMCVWDDKLWVFSENGVWHYDGTDWVYLGALLSASSERLRLAVGQDGFIACESKDSSVAQEFSVTAPGQIWEYLTPPWTVQCIDSNSSTIVFGDQNDEVVEILSSDKTVQWTFTGHTDWVNGVSYVGDSVYSCSKDGTVREINNSGVEQWSNTDFTGSVLCVALDYSTAGCTAGGVDNTVRAINGAGVTQWTNSDHTDDVLSVTGGQEYIYSGSKDNYVFRFNSSGVKQWGYDMAADVASVKAVPSSNSVYACAGNYLKRISSAGAASWSLEVKPSGSGLISITADSEYVYVSDGDGHLYKILDGGTSAAVVWTSTGTGASSKQCLTVDDSYVYYGGWTATDTGYVKKLHPGYRIDAGLASGINFRDVFYQDGYYGGIEWESNKFYLSGLEAADTWSLTDYEDAEYKQGDAIGCASFRRNLFIFKERTYEIYYNSGDSDFAFTRHSGGTYDVGLYSTDSLIEVDGTLYWMANDGTVRRLNGYTPEKISNALLEHEITDWTEADEVFAWWYSLKGQSFYVLGYGKSGSQQTFQFNVSTGLWNELTGGSASNINPVTCCEYYDSTPGGGGQTGLYYCGGYDNGWVFLIDPDSYSASWDTASERNVYREKQSQVIAASRERMFFRELEIWAKTGTHVGSDLTLYVKWSDDMGVTWNTAREIDLGSDGDYLRLRTLRLGSSYNRIFKIYSEHSSEMTMTGGFLK